MGLLSTDKVATLKKKSEDAISIFQNTINNLSKTNAEIRAEKAKQIEQLDKIKDNINALNGVEKGNEKFITKITEFLND